MQRILLVCLLFASSLVVGAADENAYRQWRTALFDALAQTKDANDYLALYLLSGHESASDGLLQRAYATGGGNAKVLWTVAVASQCPSECERAAAAAHDLVKTDSGNALAWLTLAYVVERDAGITKEVVESLKKAVKAPRLHDYGFNLMQTMIAAAGRVPISAEAIAAAPSRPHSVEEFQLHQGDGSVTVASHVVMEWLDQGCSSHGSILDGPAAVACAAAKDRRKLGDSLATLPADSEAGKRLREQLHAVFVANAAGSAKIRLQLYAGSTTEQEFTARLAQSLGH